MGETTKAVIKQFYDSAAAKSGEWQQYLADEVSFSVAAVQKFAGKETFVKTYTMVLQAVEKMEVKQLIAEGNTACAIVAYDYVSSAGAKLHQDVAELWNVADGKITSFTLYYDESEYRAFMGR